MNRICRSCGAKLATPEERFCRSCGAEATPGGRWHHWPLLAISGTLAIAMGAGAVLLLLAGGSSSDSQERPSPHDLPADVVVFITHVPSDTGTITSSKFRRALEQTAVQDGLDTAPKPGDPQYKGVRDQTLNNVLTEVWLEGQASEMDIVASKREIAAELRTLRTENFESDREFLQFLEDSNYTQDDVDRKVKLQILSTKIQRAVKSRASPGEDKDERFMNFVSNYETKWQSRTVCAQSFAIARCSNGRERIRSDSEPDRTQG